MVETCLSVNVGRGRPAITAYTRSLLTTNSCSRRRKGFNNSTIPVIVTTKAKHEGFQIAVVVFALRDRRSLSRANAYQIMCARRRLRLPHGIASVFIALSRLCPYLSPPFPPAAARRRRPLARGSRFAAGRAHPRAAAPSA
eukprot:6187284-Pleurochrysis_carterae.AAC.2